MDKYEAVRSLPFETLASALGLDLSTFTLKGKEWVGGCPIHQSKNNQGCFRYHETGVFHCFSCNAKGKGALDLVKAVKSIGFLAAVEFLSPFVGMRPPKQKEPPLGAPSDASVILKPLEKDTWRKFAVPCDWLEKRIPDAAVRERYGVFCYNNPARKSAYSGRVMLPVRDVQNVLYGYLGRKFDTVEGDTYTESPKYLFPKNLPKSRFLFGSDQLCTFGPLPLKRVFLLESPFAVMKFAAMSLPAVSAYGWSPSAEQIAILQELARGVIYLPDRNKSAESESIAGKLASKLWVRFPPLPDGIDDPEELSLPQIQAL